MKWVEPGMNGNHWLDLKQRPSACIVQPFVLCLAPSVNSLDRAISPVRVAHSTCSIVYMHGAVSYTAIA